MHLVAAQTSDYELFIEALESNSNLKIMCACSALERVFDNFFMVEYTAYEPNSYTAEKRVVSEKLQKLGYALRTALTREVGGDNEYHE